MKGNAVIGQSGGPTSVINASLAGAVSAALKNSNIETVFGMNYGIEGFMQERLINLSAQKKEILEGLKTTPSSALGSSRHKVRESDFPRILEVLKKFDIRYFFLIGGNDTMDTIHRVEKYCRSQNYELYGVYAESRQVCHLPNCRPRCRMAGRRDGAGKRKRVRRAPPHLHAGNEIQ